MSNTTRSFGAGAIITIIFAPIFLAMVYWIGEKASQVPQLEATFKTEVAHLNKALTKLTKTAEETNHALKAYTKYHAENLSRITEALVTHKYRIAELEDDCVVLNASSIECKNHLLLFGHTNGKDR